MLLSRITFIIPTLGDRRESLISSIKSCLSVEESQVRVVGPQSVAKLISDFDPTRLSFIDQGKAQGASAAINVALRETKINSDYFTWIGDDDFVHPSGIDASLDHLRAHPNIVASYGVVHYVDSSGQILFIHNPPRKSWFSLRFGPQRIAQPGMVFRSSVLHKVGNLNETLKCAWDQEFITRCSHHGKVAFVDRKVADYTWHDGALTSTFLKTSMVESAQIRAMAFPRWFTGVWQLFEYFRIFATLILGSKLTKSGNWQVLGQFFKRHHSKTLEDKF